MTDRNKTGFDWRPLAVLVAAAALAGGCSPGNLRHRQTFTPVELAECAAPATTSGETLAEAESLDRAQSDRCVDLYYCACLQAAHALVPSSPDGCVPAWQTYHQALAGLIDAGQRYGRLDPRRQLVVNDGSPRVVPTSYHGFAWQPQDFCQLAPADRFRSRDIANHYATPGLGVSLVGVRVAACPSEVFFRPRQPFAVSAVLRPTEVPGGAVLEFYNPHVYASVAWNASAAPLARDLTAPLAATVNESPRQYLRGFTAPADTASKPQLVLVEPYQRGKIPVILIHGLYSDPITWVDTANELRQQYDLYQDFQFWVYRYPTGGELLESAAELRAKLRLVRATYAPAGDDPALDAMVLIGHSLGGLVSKMQVVTSHDLLWQRVALQPFDALRAPPQMQQRLARDFFFEPVPSVTRVIFVGTPHHGSELARRLAGRIGDELVRFGTEEDEQYAQLMDDNRDVFRPQVARSRPTTVDLLEPDSPLLVALGEMPINPCVRLHSIIGTGGTKPLHQPSDGVVAVSSARHGSVESELYVPAKHEKLHRHPDSIAEMARILREHARQQSQATARRAGRGS